MNTMKTHQFTLTVTTDGSKESARAAVLYAFASRQPDGCSFDLKENPEYKQVWMEGAQAGTEIAFDLITASLQKLKTSMGIGTFKAALKKLPKSKGKKKRHP
jgi:hypothetical protein